MKALICWLFGHKYRLIRSYSPTQRRIGCCRCHEQFAMHDGLGALLPWDGEFAELYQDYK